MKAGENGFRRIVACPPGLKAAVNENKKGTGRIIAKRAMQTTTTKGRLAAG
jgi:hypothetical protein